MPLPAWLRRWAAGVLEFIEAEAKALPALLLRKGRGRKGFGASSDVVDLAGEEDEEEEGEGEHGGRDDNQLAQAAAAAAASGGAAASSEEAAEVAAEVEHQRKARIQALACAIDKAKLLLRHQASQGVGWGAGVWLVHSLLRLLGIAGAPSMCSVLNVANGPECGAFCYDPPSHPLRHPPTHPPTALSCAQESGGSRAPPLRLLSEREAVEFLWTDDDSVACRWERGELRVYRDGQKGRCRMDSAALLPQGWCFLAPPKSLHHAPQSPVQPNPAACTAPLMFTGRWPAWPPSRSAKWRIA